MLRLWLENDTYVVDFGSTAPQFFLSEGWSDPERWDNELTVAWADDEGVPSVALLSPS